MKKVVEEQPRSGFRLPVTNHLPTFSDGGESSSLSPLTKPSRLHEKPGPFAYNWLAPGRASFVAASRAECSFGWLPFMGWNVLRPTMMVLHKSYRLAENPHQESPQ